MGEEATYLKLEAFILKADSESMGFYFHVDQDERWR